MMTCVKTCVFLALAGVAMLRMCCAADGSFALVGEKGAADIVVSPQADPTSRLASEELSEYVFKASGMRCEVKMRGEDERPNFSPSVLIGTLAHFPGEVPVEAREALSRCKQFEAGWTGVKDGKLYFVGKEPKTDKMEMTCAKDGSDDVSVVSENCRNH